MCRIARWTAVALVLFLYGSVAFAGVKEDLLAKGDWLLDKEDYAAAARAYEEVIKMDPTCAKGYYGRGFIFFVKDDYDAAIRDFTETIRLNPKKGVARFAIVVRRIAQRNNWHKVFPSQRGDSPRP